MATDSQKYEPTILKPFLALKAYGISGQDYLNEVEVIQRSRRSLKIFPKPCFPHVEKVSFSTNAYLMIMGPNSQFSKEDNFARSNREGLGPLYRLAGLTFLSNMSRYPSTRLHRLYHSMQSVVNKLDSRISLMDKNPACLESRALYEIGLLKRKYLYYSSFLAAISTYPLLYRVAEDADLNEAIFIKCSSILAIKVLDNLNDEYHSLEQAYQSLDKHQAAFTEADFYYNVGDDLISRAENAAYAMTRWAYESLRKRVAEDSLSFSQYEKDMDQYIRGQKDSFLQKVTDTNCELLTLEQYLERVSEKGIGKIWLDMDLCVFEGCHGKIDQKLLELFAYIRRGLDLVHKSAQLYDDVSDLSADIKSKILNGAVFYALERGAISVTEIFEDTHLIKKLEECRVPNDVMRLGDAIFKEALTCLNRAGELSHGIVDVSALTYSVHVLRLFAVRKWLVHKSKSDALYLLSSPVRGIMTPLLFG